MPAGSVAVAVGGITTGVAVAGTSVGTIAGSGDAMSTGVGVTKMGTGSACLHPANNTITITVKMSSVCF